MGFVRIVSRKSGGDEIYLGTIGGMNFSQNDLIGYNKGDIISIDVPISETGAFYLKKYPQEDVEIWNLPDDDGKQRYRVVLNFIITEKVHSLSCDLYEEMGQLKPLCDTIIIAPISDSTETVLHFLRDVVDPPWDHPVS